ncbi:MAG: glycosyltransferase family 39 protein [Ignavibacteria bacterium]|nr:glycosyltransferase family 39 protein [Ignavibacteria bacterium]
MKNDQHGNTEVVSNREKILLFLIFVTCLSIRLAFITQKNLWFDEIFSWHLTLGSFYEIIVRTSNDIHPPLYYFILKIWNAMLGDSVLSMRLLSAIFTSSSVFFIYPISRRILNIPMSFIVLLLYVISPLNVYYSQEVRMAAMNLFFNAGSVYFLLKLTDSFISKKSGIKEVFSNKLSCLYILFTGCAIYTHYFSFFILAAQLIYILYSYRSDLKQISNFIYLWAGLIILYIPWLPVFKDHLSRGQSWRSPQTIVQVLTEYLNFIKDMNLGLYYHYTDLTLIKYITIFISAALFLAIIGLFLKRKVKKDNYAVLILLTAVIPLVLAGIISLKQKVEFYRYLSILVPYILILFVYGLNRWNKKIFIYVIILIYAGINIYGLAIQNSFSFKNDDYRSLIRKIESEFKTGDRIYVEPHYYGWIIDYYKKQNSLQLPNTTYIRYGWNEILDSINVQKPEGFWVVMDYSAVDTTKYSAYLKDLNSRFRKDFCMTFYNVPVRIDLYRFSQINNK